MKTDTAVANTYRPAWWYPAVTAAVGLIAVALFRLWIDTDPILVAIVPLSAAFAVWRVVAITLSQAGVTVGGRTVSWDALHRHQGRFGESLRADDGRFLRRRTNIFPPLYDSGWRGGPIGDDVRRWDPKLLA